MVSRSTKIITDFLNDRRKFCKKHQNSKDALITSGEYFGCPVS